MPALAVRPTEEHDALKTWEVSEHASVFTHPRVLRALAGDVHWWTIEKGSEIQAVWPVPVDSEGKPKLVPFTYYVGPLWTRKAANFPAHRSLSATKDVYCGFFETLIPRYGSIRASLPPGQDDVRWFDWWNYGDSTDVRFRIMPRYSARVNGLQAMADSDLTARMRQLRRRELRKIMKEPTIHRSEDLGATEIITLYKQTFARQGQDVATATLASLEKLVVLVQSGFGSLVGFRSKVGHPAAAILLLEAAGQAHMVLNLVHDHWRDSGIAAWAVLDAMRLAHAKGLETFDFNGANSPNRGDDKHSYGASPILYFDVAYG